MIRLLTLGALAGFLVGCGDGSIGGLASDGLPRSNATRDSEHADGRAKLADLAHESDLTHESDFAQQSGFAHESDLAQQSDLPVAASTEHGASPRTGTGSDGDPLRDAHDVHGAMRGAV